MTIDFALQRRKMVDGQLRTTDVTDVALLEAMATTPREEFVPAKKRPLAYIDEDLEVADAGSRAPARFLMEPSPFARLVQLAEIRKDDFVLDVGCATGYSSAVLSQLCGSVVALESDGELAAQATEKLSTLGYDNVAVVEGPLPEGYAGEAPFDAIVIEGAVELVPDALLDQLREGGRLVTVVGTGNAGRATIYLKEGGLVTPRRAFNAAIRELIDFRRKPAFSF